MTLGLRIPVCTHDGYTCIVGFPSPGLNRKAQYWVLGTLYSVLGWESPLCMGDSHMCTVGFWNLQA